MQAPASGQLAQQAAAEAEQRYRAQLAALSQQVEAVKQQHQQQEEQCKALEKRLQDSNAAHNKTKVRAPMQAQMPRLVCFLNNQQI